MKINPESPDFQRQVESTKTPSQTGKSFGETLASKAQSATTVSNTQVTPAGGVSEADLADPAKANAAIDRAVQELMDKEFSGIRGPDREQITAWLRSDPMIRAGLLRGLT